MRATFFVLGRVAERHPELVREIAAAGPRDRHPRLVAHADLPHAPEEFRDELRRSVRLLEDLAGRPVLGHRAPFFSITRQSLWALDDPGRGGPPLRLEHLPGPQLPLRDRGRAALAARRRGRPRPIVEFPITTWRVAGTNLPDRGRRLLPDLSLRLDPAAACARSTGRATRRSSTCTPGSWTRSTRASACRGASRSRTTSTCGPPRDGCAGCCGTSASRR